MIDYGKVRSTVKPDPIVIDDFSVWHHTDIQEVSENIGEDSEFHGYEFRMIQYDKDEYIHMMAEQNRAMEDDLTNTQLALCDVYELLEGMGG